MMLLNLNIIMSEHYKN